MKFLVACFLTTLLSFAGGLFFPWWVIAIAAFVVAAVVPLRSFQAFLSAFLALFVLWGLLSFFIDLQNQHILATKVAAILPLGGSYIAAILVTAFIGAVVAGFAALTGSYLRTPARKAV
jgi:hypothetical protein